MIPKRYCYYFIAAVCGFFLLLSELTLVLDSDTVPPPSTAALDDDTVALALYSDTVTPSTAALDDDTVAPSTAALDDDTVTPGAPSTAALDDDTVPHAALRSNTGGAVPVASTTCPSLFELHAFYYLWYGTPAHDGKWLHWNHEVLPHWNEHTRQRFPHGMRLEPPEQVGAAYVPLALYSSRDPAYVRRSLEQLRDAGVGVVVVSWWGRADMPNTHDGQMVETDSRVQLVLDEASGLGGIRVAFHLEPYAGRTAQSVRDDVVYIFRKYAHSPSFYRDARSRRPIFYCYDSYHIPYADWAQLLSPSGAHTLRNTEFDADFIALALNEADVPALAAGHFDGFYSYFAATGFTRVATPAAWPALQQTAQQLGLRFIPCVGPGYDDTRIRPWNSENLRPRNGGRYYDEMFRAAVATLQSAAASGDSTVIIGLTSWNEWGEGTQIEPAQPYSTASHTYADYSPEAPDFYLQLTRKWALLLANSTSDF